MIRPLNKLSFTLLFILLTGACSITLKAESKKMFFSLETLNYSHNLSVKNLTLFLSNYTSNDDAENNLSEALSGYIIDSDIKIISFMKNLQIEKLQNVQLENSIEGANCNFIIQTKRKTAEEVIIKNLIKSIAI